MLLTVVIDSLGHPTVCAAVLFLCFPPDATVDVLKGRTVHWPSPIILAGTGCSVRARLNRATSQLTYTVTETNGQNDVELFDLCAKRLSQGTRMLPLGSASNCQPGPGEYYASHSPHALHHLFREQKQSTFEGTFVEALSDDDYDHDDADDDDDDDDDGNTGNQHIIEEAQQNEYYLAARASKIRN